MAEVTSRSRSPLRWLCLPALFAVTAAPALAQDIAEPPAPSDQPRAESPPSDPAPTEAAPTEAAPTEATPTEPVPASATPVESGSTKPRPAGAAGPSAAPPGPDPDDEFDGEPFYIAPDGLDGRPRPDRAWSTHLVVDGFFNASGGAPLGGLQVGYEPRRDLELNLRATTLLLVNMIGPAFRLYLTGESFRPYAQIRLSYLFAINPFSIIDNQHMLVGDGVTGFAWTTEVGFDLFLEAGVAVVDGRMLGKSALGLGWKF